MIQLGYCIPIPEESGNDSNNLNSHHADQVTGHRDDDHPSTNFPPPHIGHISIDWSQWDGGQIGGTPSWLHPEYLPSGPLTCHCTNPKCPCSFKSQQPPLLPLSAAESIAQSLNDTDAVNQGDSIREADSSTKMPSLQHPTILNFIGQFYAPPPPPSLSTLTPIDGRTGSADIFHRTIYMFACTKCHLSQCYHRIRVIRTQLVQRNRYWPPSTTAASPSDHDDNDPTKPWVAHLPRTYCNKGLCIICNFPAKGKCPIQQQNFCSSQHQRLYHSMTCATKRKPKASNVNEEKPNRANSDTTTNGQHNHSLLDATASSMNGIYTMMEMVVEEEPDIPTIVEILDDDASKLPSTLFPNSNRNTMDGGDVDSDDDDDDEDIEQHDLNDAIGKNNHHHRIDEKRKRQNDENQKVFHQFTNRITERPNCRDQVLRYNCSWPEPPHDGTLTTTNNQDPNIATLDLNDYDDNETEPLWIRADHRPPSTLPKCPYCNSERQFEFQIMPQLLHYLTVISAVPTTTTKANHTNDHVVLEALRQTETILEQFHPSNIPPALIEHQQSIIEQRRQQLLLRDNEDTSAESSRKTAGKDELAKDLLRPPHDWGVVVVYTCPNSCSPVSSGNVTGELNDNGTSTMDTLLGAYREEYVWVQPPIDVMTTSDIT